MSREDQKAGRIDDMDFSALDQELAGMAQDTPEVPADFHARWTQAIREDAKNNPREEASAGAEKTEHRQADIRRQRRHILSAAAAFVLVIGGVWLLRDKTDVLNKVKTTSAPAVQEEAGSAPADKMEQEEALPASAPDSEGEENGTWLSAEGETPAAGAESISEDSAGEAPLLMANYTAAGGSAGEASYETSPINYDGGGSAGEASYKASARSEDAALEFEAEEAEEASYDMMFAGEAAEAEYEPVSTQEPAPAPESTPVPTAAPTAAPEAAETAEQPEVQAAAAPGAEAGEAEDEENIPFLQRVWNFLLRITPWALGVVVITLFLVTYAIRAKQRKGK